ncbi:hypothetical protein ACFOY2_20500 [Nonomuraea purpurea]|uniref:DUF3618 domain-containing protein n=1 Tax=Nonomuraea purpurea TaxID=1849276 RepID=A0ABV8G962_9ACTN
MTTPDELAALKVALGDAERHAHQARAYAAETRRDTEVVRTASHHTKVWGCCALTAAAVAVLYPWVWFVFWS